MQDNKTKNCNNQQKTQQKKKIISLAIIIMISMFLFVFATFLALFLMCFVFHVLPVYIFPIVFISSIIYATGALIVNKKKIKQQLSELFLDSISEQRSIGKDDFYNKILKKTEELGPILTEDTTNEEIHL